MEFKIRFVEDFRQPLGEFYLSSGVFETKKSSWKPNPGDYVWINMTEDSHTYFWQVTDRFVWHIESTTGVSEFGAATGDIQECEIQLLYVGVKRIPAPPE